MLLMSTTLDLRNFYCSREEPDLKSPSVNRTGALTQQPLQDPEHKLTLYLILILCHTHTHTHTHTEHLLNTERSREAVSLLSLLTGQRLIKLQCGGSLFLTSSSRRLHGLK